MSDKDQPQSQLQPQPQPVIAGYYPMYQAPKNDEIDLFDLIAQLWKKKHWIIGCMLVTTLLAAAYAFTAKEQWTATAVVDVPSFDSMDNYYQGTRLLEGNVDKPISSEEVAEKLFKQFISQAGSYNELSKFISESDYFKKSIEGQSESQKAKLLNEIVDKIKILKDKDDLIYTINFPANTPYESKKLLEDYIKVVNTDISKIQYAQLASLISNRKNSIQNQMNALKKIAEDRRQEEIKNIKMALTIANRSNIQKPELSGLTKLDTNSLFLLGKNALNAMSENIIDQPLTLTDDYYSLQGQYINLERFKVDGNSAQAFRYLKGPTEPVNKDKPLRILILIVGLVFGLILGLGASTISIAIQNNINKKNIHNRISTK